MADTKCSLACFQETKLQIIDDGLARFLGGYKLDKFAFKPARGTRGGILLLWTSAVFDVQEVRVGRFLISAQVTVILTGATFLLTGVYGPTRHHLKDSFLRHIRRLRPSPGEGWLILGDFNMIYHARDKNNSNVNLARMRRFRSTIDRCELHEIPLQNRKFTWSNERRRATLVKLDRYFCNETWDLAFPHHVLHALPTGPSDHCPLVLSDPQCPRRLRAFKFENFWTRIPGFKDKVKDAWCQPSSHTEPMHLLNEKLYRTATCLREWEKGICTEAKLQFHMALDVIKRLDVAQEHRDLSAQETRLRAALKHKILGLAFIERARKKQASRLTHIREGDANTKFFYLKMNVRRRKNTIHWLKKDNGWAVTHEEKEATIHDHFASIMGRPALRPNELNWDALDISPIDLATLGEPSLNRKYIKQSRKCQVTKLRGQTASPGFSLKSVGKS
jgi:hypothetical protein